MMSGFQARDTMPKLGHVTDLREQWLVRADGALAHHLQDREISSHLCENRYRNQQIREDFPVALNEQQGIDNEVRMRELSRLRQAEIDGEIAREMAEINLRRQRRQQSNELLLQPGFSQSQHISSAPSTSVIKLADDIDPEQLGLTPSELEEIKRRLEQEEKDARLARELSQEGENKDSLLADMKCAVEAQDGELARLLQEREYKKLQRAKEKARQKALLKKQRMAAQKHAPLPNPTHETMLCDAYSNPKDMVPDNQLRLCKSVDSDLNYVEPFEKEHIQSKASALHLKQVSSQYYTQGIQPGTSHHSNLHSNSSDSAVDGKQSSTGIQYRQPPLPPITGRKPRFPDPISIRPASHYSAEDNSVTSVANNASISHSHSENNNVYSAIFPSDNNNIRFDGSDDHKRLSVISDITAEGLEKKINKQNNVQNKRKGCKIQ